MIRLNASNHIKKSQEYNKCAFDKHHIPPQSYQVGDYVMIKNYDSTQGVSKKLIPKMKGPYVVTSILNHDRYIVEDVEGFQVSRVPYQGTIEAKNMRMYCKQ